METIEAKAEELKNSGNEAFKAGNYQLAINLYTDALGTHSNILISL